jgi:phage terminase large subunit-like protein
VSSKYPAEKIVDEYISGIKSGEVPACRWVKLVVERYLRDLKTCHKRGFVLDRDLAQDRIDFFQVLRHTKGKWGRGKGEVFNPSPWQVFWNWNVYGWVREADGLRRFRTGYLEVARKNGKSTMLASDGVFLLDFDNEPGAEVYSAATKFDQAKIIHSEATNMVRKSPGLQKHIKIYRNNLNVVETASKYLPLGRDSKTYDGLNIHGALIDELHEHPDRSMWDVLETGTGAREQPLMLAITTAGSDRNGICYEQRDYLTKILKNTIEDDTYFGMIFTIDTKTDWGKDSAEDNWQDEKVWEKANPNLGVSVYLDDLQRKAKKAKEIPAAQNNFLRKHLNVWTEQSERWISMALWDANFACEIDETQFAGKVCYGGLDLASVSDLACWLMVFPNDEGLDILVRFWCPEARLTDPKNRYRDHYQAWERAGLLETTPGDAVDYTVIERRVLEDAETFNIHSANVDRLFQGYELAMRLADEGLELAGFAMGAKSMGVPAREFEKMLLRKELNHGNNPIMRFCADNVAVIEDINENKRPIKGSPHGKIDGIVCLLMAMDRMLRNEQTTSVYETRGVLSF